MLFSACLMPARRLARIRLLPQPPLDHPPLSLLGFDPYLSHPSLPEFLALLNARPRSTIKGLIMDQAFSAGVGNWVADEILYQARVHPACPVGMLTEEQKEAVWREMRNVVVTAVEVNADHRKFPKGTSCRLLHVKRGSLMFFDTRLALFLEMGKGQKEQA